MTISQGHFAVNCLRDCVSRSRRISPPPSRHWRLRATLAWAPSSVTGRHRLKVCVICGRRPSSRVHNFDSLRGLTLEQSIAAFSASRMSYQARQTEPIVRAKRDLSRMERIAMSPVTHFLTGWVVANSSPALNVRERILITAAGVVPDLDGLGAIPELLTKDSQHPLAWFTLYHHQLHNLAFGLLVAAVTFALANHRWVTGLLALFSFHLHLIEDLLGGRGPDGYQWPIPYLSPFSHGPQLAWRGQWALNAWPKFAITGCLLILTFYLARSTGHSPLEMVSYRADAAFVRTLQRRFPA